MKSEKFIHWIMFSVLVALVPFGFKALTLFLQQLPILMSELTGRGELLLVAVVLTAVAIGDLFVSNQRISKLRLLCCGFCTISLIFTSCVYAWVSASIDSSTLLNLNNVALISIWLYVFSIIASLSVLWVSEV